MSSKVSEMCGFGRLRAIERGSKVRGLIGGRRAAFVGDSGARRAYGAFIAAMSDERADVSLKTKDGEKHRDWAHELVGGARATFTWAPYASDATTALEKYASASETPDLIVLSSSLWHVLHDDSVSTYKSAMKTLGARAREMTAIETERRLRVVGRAENRHGRARRRRQARQIQPKKNFRKVLTK